MIFSQKYLLLNGWYSRRNTYYWTDDTLVEIPITERMILSQKYLLLNGWYSRRNTYYWTDDALAETPITERMILSQKYLLLNGWYSRRNTYYWTDDTLAEIPITERMILSRTSNSFIQLKLGCSKFSYGFFSKWYYFQIFSIPCMCHPLFYTC
jgi:hypothetical protein